MLVFFIAGFVVLIAALLWRSGSVPISDELRTSLSPQELETLQSDLNFRKVLGQVGVASTSLLLLLWLVW
jgi:hypothetical protein